MGAIVIFVIIIALTVLALQRNHARQRDGTHPLAGSGTATDRDAQRIVVDIEAARARRSGGVTFAGRLGFPQAAGAGRAHTLRAGGGAGTLRTVVAAPGRGRRPHRR